MSQKRYPKILTPISQKQYGRESKDAFVFSSNLKHHCRHIVETKEDQQPLR